MSPSRCKSQALIGAGFFLLILLKSLALVQGSPAARMAVGLCLLVLAGLAVYLLRREGCRGDALFAMLLPIGLAFFLRVLLLDHVTLDYQDFLSPWVSRFRDNGGFAALKDPVGNYNVPYLYVLAALSCLPFPDLYGIKLFSILFDVLLAWGGLRLAKQLSPSSPSSAAFPVLLLLPTVILNGACWGQCDSIWSALCLWALVFAFEAHPVRSLSFLALAFSFKLQAVFIIPLWCALWFSGRVKLRHLLAFPCVFALSTVPALLCGKPAGDILRIYLNQAGDSVSWKTLNYNSPSVFALFPYRFGTSSWVPKAAIGTAFLFMLGVLLLLRLRRERLDVFSLTLAGTAFSLGIPFLLPYMHERYFFLGGILLTVISSCLPSTAPAAVGAELASLGGYHAYLMKRYVMVLSLFGTMWSQLAEGLLMLFAVLTALVVLHRRTS